MDIKLCVADGCTKVAVGTGIRPVEHCREHYVAVYGPEFQQFKVIIPWRELGLEHDEIAIACAKTGEDIHEGGTVWLDPVNTNILTNIYSQFIEAIPEPKPAAKPAKAEA